MKDLWSVIEDQVFSVESTAELFNPYASINPEFDREDATSIRRENLRRYVFDHEKGVALLLVAEAPGPWGCRFSGVPITSESHLVDPNFPLSGRQSSLRDKPYTEYSAGIYWRLLSPYYDAIFTWNTVPLHPHDADDPLSIRTPRQTEIVFFLPVMEKIMRAFNPQITLAVGRKAENALRRIGVDARYVRHPSQGGARLFEAGVLEAINELGLLPSY